MKQLKLASCLFIITQLVYSQAFYKPKHDFWEGWVGIGGASYNGEIGSKLNSFLLSFEAGGRYFLSNHLAVNGRALFAELYGDDLITDNPRAYSFDAFLGEFTGNMEIYLLFEGSKFKRYKSYKGSGTNKFNFFVTVGGGYMLFNNKTYINGEYERLTDKSYENAAFVLPYGGGVRYTFDNTWALSFNLSNRLTTTDFLDDISLTGRNDSYLIAVFNIVYKLDKTKFR